MPLTLENSAINDLAVHGAVFVLGEYLQVDDPVINSNPVAHIYSIE